MKDFLELYTIKSNVLNDAIDKIVVKLHGINKKEGAKMFLFTGAGANGGTTTVGINIAISLAEAGWKTVFVDADFRKDQRYKRIGTGAASSLTEYLTGDISAFRRIIYKTNVENLEYIVSGDRNDNPVRLLCNSRMETLLTDLRESYDFVIIDTPPISISNDAEILIPNVDKYMIVVCMNETRKKQLVDARVQLADYEDKYAGIVVNKMELLQYKNVVKDYDYFSPGNLIQKQKNGMSKGKGE